MTRLKLVLYFFFLTGGVASAQTFRAYISAGEKAMADKDYYSATEYFIKALEFENNDLSLKFKMAEASRLFNDVNVAAYWYNQVVLNDRENRYPVALFYLAMMNKMKGEYETAKNLFFKYNNLHAADSNYYSIRAHKEIAGCETAYQLTQHPVGAEVSNMGNTINTVYSDFAGYLLGDSVLYYSSLRFPSANSKTKETKAYFTRILKSAKSRNKWHQPTPLPEDINQTGIHNANLTFSSDNQWIVFTRCQPLNKAEMRCELFASRFKNGSWSKPFRLPDSINKKGTTSTQPALALRGAEGYTLYYVSDRDSGFGNLDIWYALMTADGQFSEPLNAGSEINTGENEITPFFNDETRTLYFSSDRSEGLGGYDVFYSAKVGETQFSAPENAGYPINSSYHDLYFTTSFKEDRGMITSNRPGSMYIKSKTCCYDLYEYVLTKKQPPLIDTLIVLDGSSEPDTLAFLNDTPKIKATRRLLPLVLYFDNDQPDPKTVKTETNWRYDDLYYRYLSRKNEFVAEYSKGLSEQKRKAAENAINKLFSEVIISSFARLDSVASLLSEELQDGKKITLVVRGQASPLASTAYNENLSKRRISSLVNYLLNYKNRSLEIFSKKGSLNIEWIAAGKSLAPADVSDDLNDLRNSVYSPKAALERKIELINVKIE